MPQYGSFSAAYAALLARLFGSSQYVEGVTDETSIGFGNGYYERIGEGFILTNPIDRIPRQKARNFNLKNAVALTALLLSGSQKVADIKRYNSRAPLFADDGMHMLGAHGYRIKDQLWGAVRLLKADPTTRRAMLSVYGPDDVLRQSKDVPCVATLHFLLRNGSLDLCVHMRSQSTVMVMPYDVFSFTVLQELIALELGVRVGFYYHFMNSAHYFMKEQGMLSAILNDTPTSDQALSFFPAWYTTEKGTSPLGRALEAVRGDFDGFVDVHLKRLQGEEKEKTWIASPQTNTFLRLPS